MDAHQSAYPVYQTPNGTPYKAYVAVLHAKTFPYEDGTWTGPHGTVGAYLTAEQAITAARRALNEQCWAEVIDTRHASGEPVTIWSAGQDTPAGGVKDATR